MNECFVVGSVISDINFSFSLRKKPYSVTTFNIRLSNNAILEVYAFDELADFCYRKLKHNDNIFVYGKLNSNIKLKLIAREVEIIFGKMTNKIIAESEVENEKRKTNGDKVK